MRRLNRAFLAARPLSHLKLTNKTGLNFLTQVCVLRDDDWEVTKPSVAWPKFLNPVFSVRVNCEASMPYKPFLFISKLQLLLKTFKNIALKRTRSKYLSKFQRFKR